MKYKDLKAEALKKKPFEFAPTISFNDTSKVNKALALNPNPTKPKHVSYHHFL